MKKYLNEAIIGNKNMLATYTQKGELQRIYYPTKDNRQFIDFFYTGVKINDSNLIYLHEDINNIYRVLNNNKLNLIKGSDIHDASLQFYEDMEYFKIDTKDLIKILNS